MKPETQIKIARGTALVLTFLTVLYPLVFLDEIIQEKKPITVVLYMGLFYAIALPFIVVFAGYAWALKHRLPKIVISLFNIITVGAVVIVVYGGVDDVLIFVIQVVLWFLLLQGRLGIRKMQISAPKTISNNNK